MTGVTFTVELDGAAARAHLAALVDQMDRPIGFYKSVGEYLTEEAVPRNFDAEAAPDGQSWASLSPVTIARREAAGHVPIKILTATKTLSASIISQPTAEGVKVGSPVIYAGVMQLGAGQGAFGAFMGKDKRGRDHFHHLPWGGIPARPYLGIGPEDEAEIIAIAREWLDLT